MGNTASSQVGALTPTNKFASPPPSPTPSEQAQPKCKPCCACPDTRKVRDDCVIQFGEEKCADLIKKHQECMREMGFNI
ncbi:cytochrome C oxidase copper chaperone-domain-containing protein [Cladochytrium replicatum]|nr:cytochrome C oxidase copper chaperone-domain-containing protein [Cladochytrium replicatum]